MAVDRMEEALEREFEESKTIVTSDSVQGTVIEIRPKALYRVRLLDGHVVTVNVANSLRHAIVRILVNDKVLIRLSKNDPHRGQIIQLAD